jgi:hypothetical protein
VTSPPKARKKADPHAILKPPGTLVCLHCGEKYAMALPIPIALMSALMGTFDKEHRGCKVGVRGVACHHCLGFGHAPEKCSLLAYGGDWRAWLHGPDTGQSSKTLCYALAGHLADAKREGNYPYDGADFGRCHRLLAAIPGWRARIGEAREISATWARLADAWDELEALYLEELPTGRCPRLHARISELTRPGAS